MAGPRGVGPRRLDERTYERAIRRYTVSPIMRSIRKGISEAGSAAEAIRTLDAAGPGFVLDENGLAGAVKAAGDRAAAAHRQAFVKSFRSALKVDVSPLLQDGPIASYLDQWRTTNVSLIRTIPPRFHATLEKEMTEFFRKRPFDRGGLRKVVERSGRVTGYNARRIARDQTSKAIGQFTKFRQQELGIESFLWRTAADEKVRPSHAEKEGVDFLWSAPPADTGPPGFDVQCRCRAEAYQLQGGRSLISLRPAVS